MASGKSAIAAGLIDSGYVRLSFAQPLKNIAELAYGKVDKSGEYEITTLDGVIAMVSGREVLQGVGQSIKSHDRDFWLKCFFNAAKNYLDTPVVVDDGRFTFERDALSQKGWLIVGIDTPEGIRHERYMSVYGRYPTMTELTHQSEIELPNIIRDADIVVSGVEDPYENVRTILHHAKQDKT